MMFKNLIVFAATVAVLGAFLVGGIAIGFVVWLYVF